ncbi:MAG TPA: zf-HC2 domain-containing protein [Sporichthya sp.]|nr:zf-HC2 domain-containing protein [Sporichthya sp.]
MTNHLGNRLAAYVDGELPYVTRELISAHLLICSTCRAAVEAESRTKTGLTHLGTPDPSAHLLGALLDLAAPGEPMPPRRRPLGREPVPPVVPVGKPVRIAFLGLSEPAIPYETRGSRVRRSLLAAGAAGIAAVTLASAHAQHASGSSRPAGGPGAFAQVVGGQPTQPNVEQVFEGTSETGGTLAYGHIRRR